MKNNHNNDSELVITKQIYAAIIEGNVEEVKTLIKGNPAHLYEDVVTGSWLHLAVRENQLEIVKWLIDFGLDVNVANKNRGGTALSIAAQEGHYEMVKYLLKRGANVNFEPPHPYKDVLFSAILSGNKEVVQLLIDHGVDTTIRYFERKDAELMAKEQNQTEILALIQAHNATLPEDHVPRTTPKEEDEGDGYEEEDQYEEEKPASHAVIRAAFEEVYGPVQMTYRERFPSEVPIEAHIIAPSTAYPYYVLFTTGMSDKALGYNLLYVENMMKVPANWLDGGADWSDKEKIWPLNWLVELANIPHNENVHPERGVIVPNKGELVHPYGIETHLSCMLISTPTVLDIQRLPIEGKEIRIDELIPVYKAEWQYAEANGYAALQEKLTAAQVQEVIDFQRPSVVDMSASEVPSKPIKKLKKLSNSETIRQTFEKEYGPIALQFTDLLEESDPAIQISGNIIYPTKKHPYYVLVTLGVSNGISLLITNNDAYEMLMKLPLDWVASEEEWTLPEKNWPLRLMMEFGYHVRKNIIEIDSYSTFPVEGKTATILSEYTEMDHLLARGLKESSISATWTGDCLVGIRHLIPIYKSEMDYAEGIYGADLLRLLEKQQADNVLVVNRPPSI
ncbi:ankyrin repeat domain-containing protein [Kurthia senegalensis]|uniref:ankyrin repeat domain-containing protein n=1 Tax=Kurthia senegalensis TaxID=1033740 RepID=UPI000289512E|nr:ankyrin repeat domain-containing protein [Kurthia senegalensis]